MDIKIDKTIPRMSDEDTEEMMERSRSIEDASPEELAALREEMKGVKSVVIPEHVMEQLKEAGMTPDEVVAMILGKLKLTQ